MILISEAMGRPKGSKNKGTIMNQSKDLEKRIFDILSIFAQKGFFDFTVAAVDDKAVMDTKDSKLISLYNELVPKLRQYSSQKVTSTTGGETGNIHKVLTKLYGTFSTAEELNKAMGFLLYVQRRKLSNDNDIPMSDDLDRDQVRKLYKDYENRSTNPVSLNNPNSPIQSRHKDGDPHPTLKTKSQQKNNLMSVIPDYLKNHLKLDDNEIASRLDALFSEKRENTELRPSDDEEFESWEKLQEHIVRDFKRFL
jgi:hypothetical protein